MAENRGTLPKSLWAGVKVWWGADYKEHPEVCRQVFDASTSSQAFEEDVQITGMTMAQVKDEGQSSTYSNINQGYTSRYTHVAYSQGFIVTREQFADNQYAKVGRARTKALSRAFRVTKEMMGANVLNRATTAGYVGGDGVTLLNTAHPEKVGTFSNRPTIATDFSESALEDLLIQIMTATDSLGYPIMLQGKKLIIPPQLTFAAERVLKSTLQSGTANNDINAVRSKGLLPDGIVTWNYLTDTDAWFIKTDAMEGLKMYQREAREISREGDFDTGNLKVKGYERYSFNWTDPRGLYGSPGAA